LLIVPLSYIILCAGVPFLLLAWIPVVGRLLGAIVDFLLFIQNEITYTLQELPVALWQGIHLPLAGMLAIWGILWIWGNWELGNRKILAQMTLVLGFLWAISNLWTEVRRPTHELFFFTKDQQRILDLRLGEHHLSWNQDFPVAQLSYSILPNRLAGQRNPVPMSLKGIVGKDSIWFPGIKATFFPSQNRLEWGSLQPKERIDFSQTKPTEALPTDSIFTAFSGFKVNF
jgi:competence protein ComEC